MFILHHLSGNTTHENNTNSTPVNLKRIATGHPTHLINPRKCNYPDLYPTLLIQRHKRRPPASSWDVSPPISPQNRLSESHK